MSQTTFLIVAGVSLALLAASGNIDGFRARPRMPQRVLSQAELQLFTTTRATGEIVMAGSSGVIIDQGFQAVRVGADAITFLAGSTADTEVVRIGTNGNVGIGTTNSSTNKLTVQGAARLNGTSAALELNDGNSGLTYSSSTNAFVGTGTAAKPSNGPVLFGQTDGALGVKGGGQANALYWNSTGVGIKNNAPAYALDVTGSVHATSNAVFDSNVGIGNSSPAYKLDVTGGVHATSNAIFDSKVGIGTSAPGASYALDVTGGVHATSNAIFDSKVGIGTSAPGASYALDVTGGVHATSNAIFDSKVGIGNAAPGANYALDVTGNVNFTGSLYQGGSLFKTSQWTTTGSDIIYTAGKIGIGVTAPTAAIHVASGSDINLSNALVVKNTTTTTLAASASLGLTFASLNDNVTNGRTSYDPSYVLFTVDNTLPGPSTTWASTGAVPFAANSVFVVNITLSSTDSFPPGVTITTNDAAGDIGYDNTADFWSAGGTRATATAYTSTFTLAHPTNRVGIRVRGGYGRTVRVHAFSVSAQAATNASAVNVGVGTTNPDSPLTIVGTAASAAASSLTLAQQWKAQHVIYAQGAAYALKLGAHYTNGVGAYSSIQSTEFYSGTEHPGIISLNPLGGNVGIGITNPPERLTVRGPSASTYAAGFASIGLYTGFGGQNVSGADAVVNQISMGGYGPYIRAVIPNWSYSDNMRLDLCTNLGSNDSTPTPRLTIVGGATTNSGNVGIGTTSPGAPLHVYSIITTNTPSIGMGAGYYFNNGGPSGLGTWQAGWGFGLSIISRGSIACGDSIVAASDERIKKNIEPVQGALDKIRRLDIVSYDRIDYRAQSVEAGVLARNVRSVLPNAVNTTKDTIPNIYLQATHLKIQSGVLIEVKCDDKDIKEGSKVKLMITQGEKEVEHLSNMTNWTGSSFEVEEWKEYSEDDKVFAYGVEVDDFLNVDKEQIGILAAGAVKELVEKVEDLTAKSDAQSREISELKRLVGSLLR